MFWDKSKLKSIVEEREINNKAKLSENKYLI